LLCSTLQTLSAVTAARCRRHDSRPQVAAVICRFRIFRSTSHWEHVLRQEPRDRLDLDRMHTGIDKEYTERQHAAMLAARHSAASVAAGCSCVLCRTLGWMARKATVWSCWHLYCSIYAAAHWTDLRSALAQAVSTINRQRNAAGRQQGNQPQSTCNVCSTSCVALSAWSLSDSGIRDAQ
jgi:hypothetical protein